MRRSPSRRSTVASTSALTRVTIAPTVRHATRSSWHTARLRGPDREPGGQVIEVPGVPGAVAGPRHRGDHDAVASAADPRRGRLEEHLRRPQVQRSPAAAALAVVIARGPSPAAAAAAPGLRVRPDRHHDRRGVVVVDEGNHRGAQSTRRAALRESATPPRRRASTPPRSASARPDAYGPRAARTALGGFMSASGATLPP